MNLTAQHLFFYKDGELILESDFVSGNTSRGYTTPPGIFGLTYKQRDAVLKGENYRSPVKFWMPFNGGIGFHDASCVPALEAAFIRQTVPTAVSICPMGRPRLCSKMSMQACR